MEKSFHPKHSPKSPGYYKQKAELDETEQDMAISTSEIKCAERILPKALHNQSSCDHLVEILLNNL